MINNNVIIQLDWDKKIFFEKKKRKYIIGWNLKGSFNSFGKGQFIDNWIIMYINNKNFKKLKTTIQLFKFNTWLEKYYINCFYYLGHLYYNSYISGYNYIKTVTCSRLIKKRLKW